MKPEPTSRLDRPPEATDLLQQSELFKGVSLTAIRHVLAHCSERKFTFGDLLLSPDTANDEMYILLNGTVTIYLDSLDSAPLTTLGAGDCVGEMSLFDGQRPSAYVKAREPTVVLVIAREALWDLIDTSHEVSRNLLRLLSTRLRANNTAMTEIQRQKRLFEHDASHDALTGLNNRRWLDAFLVGFQGPDLVPYLPLSVVMLDVDHFKHLNDTYGHLAGDRVLQELAAVLMQNVRPPDLMARYGGEEFIIILLNTPRSRARVIAQRLLERTSSHRVQFDGQALPLVTLSAGIAEGREAEPVEHLIKRADAALYRAKDAGRNRVSD